MRLLLTRTADGAAKTREKLESAGHRVVVSPVIDIAPTGAHWPDGVVDAVVATSGQAFAVMEGWSAPSREARRLLPLYLVGGQTAIRARERGFVGAAIITPNVAVLAAELAKLADASKRLVYLAGRDRKPDVETALEIAGVHSDILEVYDARAANTLDSAAVDGLRNGTVRTVLHFSRRSAELFQKLAERAEIDTPSLTHLCLSEDVALPLRSAGCNDIKVAGAPNEAALVALVGPA